ncbi:MAG: YbhB/YbcL family Raf kinase inhibitor-like protein [Candidatus Yanofskybacteria bacterium CG10_big_fil_rev_8_21_14_0_10_36_16]|uniref:YbhB/YbcL family Raf kinase inhibitor-like protein n=1 Tax=Candidatus Yanofskybacteria bacterium CG10_big_fil_rev_8_21_14_0_10_36_16 TaxID=1975096 RepID=A0A2J0Q6K4_9BACT|nr:MAG: YbhB/YbcL family Raf kinase inhibitor-like protein [Candidatus Yanofskybacteria bacterium CG10_big_fil_rev_8_21_14_0_10_36_16]
MNITSPSFNNGESVPSTYTCDGGNINPPLQFSEVPKEAKSLALIVDDPDAPVGTWFHWVMWNIKPETTEIRENVPPAEATQGMTSFGKTGYGGPCPPSGQHHYHFKLYALDTELNLSQATDAEALENAMMGHILEQAELVGTYER